MVYITGDMHGSINDFHNKMLEIRQMNDNNEISNDVLIVCGDFGFIWTEEKYYIEKIQSIAKHNGITIAFVDGNHENFDILYSYPVKEWNGGKVHKIAPNIVHLIRGEMFNIEGKNFFAFGGASSHDISDGIIARENYDSDDNFYMAIYNARKFNLMCRVKGETWWEQEMPNEEEMIHGLGTLLKNNNKVDYIVTHCCPQSIAVILSNGTYKADKLTNYFNSISRICSFDQWYCGHYHVDKQIYNYRFLYKEVEQVV